MLNGILENQKKYYIDYLTSKSKDANIFLRESYNSTNHNSIKDYFLLDGEDIGMKLTKIINLPIELYDQSGELISIDYEIKDLKNKEVLDIALNGNPIYEKTDGNIIYLAPIYDYDKQIGICKIQYNTFKEDQLYLNIRILYLNIAIYSTIIVSIIGSVYFSNIANKILGLNKLVENIGAGEYSNKRYFNTKDELEYLNKGIIDLSNIIENNINDLNYEKEKLEFMIQKLKDSELQQKNFIGNITHEFKTPLTILKIQLDMSLLYNDDKDILITGKDIMNKEIKRLDGMIENILYLSKIQKYEYEFNKERLCTKDLLEEVIYRFKYQSILSEVKIYSNLEDITLLMDKDSFLQIFINLIDNAIKYNIKNGKIIINSFIKENNIYIKIKNTGPKIEEDEINKIFQPFYIIEKSRNKKISGTGLGLPLVKKIIEKQDGKIEFKSSEEFNVVTVMFKNI